MRLAIYHEHCPLAGRGVGDRELEQAEMDNEGRDCDPWEGGDWFVLDGSLAWLCSIADLREQKARPGGGGQYDRRVAKTIREAVYDEAPELEPVEYAD